MAENDNSLNVVQVGHTQVFDLVKVAREDLHSSGLKIEDMNTRPLTNVERAAVGCGYHTQGYVIPYYTLDGSPLPFYRVKILTPETENGIRYKQPKREENHLYFPTGFKQCVANWCLEHQAHRCVLITEGEKKATACQKLVGLPCIGLSGVDSWKSRTLVLPRDTAVYQKEGQNIKAQLPAGDINIPELQSLAKGFGDLIDLLTSKGLTAIIVFDSDSFGGVKSEVQRAATMLAYELKYLGVATSHIKQLVLPAIEGGGKVGLDDYILSAGADALVERVLKVCDDPKAFPRHPNPKGFINTQLEGATSRREKLQISTAILTELDARGLRLRDPDLGQPFYYDGQTHRLMPAVLVDQKGEVLHQTVFGTLLYQEFGLSGNDKSVLTWLASQFTGEPPIGDVRPRRVLTLITEKEDALNPDGIAWQVSDSAYYAVSPEGVALKTNGTNGILFEQDQVRPLDLDRVSELLEEQLYMANERGTLDAWWRETIDTTNLGRQYDHAKRDAAGEQMANYATLLFYISPYLQRWHGAQLPIELMLGEPGSGKSSLYNLRLQIITGDPRLRNMPTDIRDWQASVANAGGLHVIDNVHFPTREIRQRLSDEICRIITEPNPTIEMRRLYTNNEQDRIPVQTTFAMTALENPFLNADIIQRAVIFRTCPMEEEPDGDWVQKQLDDRGGREAWVAHHLAFLHLFLKQVHLPADEGGWDPNFKTRHRLAHLEQCLVLASRVLGLDVPREALSGTLQTLQQEALEESDWTLVAIRDYIRDVVSHKGRAERWTISELCQWAAASETHMDNHQVTSVHKMGRYFSQHKSGLRRMFGIESGAQQGNQKTWYIPGPQMKRLVETNFKALNGWRTLVADSPTNERPI